MSTSSDRSNEMAQPSPQLSFFDLPKEIRDMIYKEVFQTLSITVHNESNIKCLADKSTRISTYCNMLRVSRQCNTEVRSHFPTSSTNCYVRPDCWERLDSVAVGLVAKFRHIVLTPKACHSSDLDFVAGMTAVETVRDSLKSGHHLNTNFSTISYDRDFCPFVKERGGFRIDDVEQMDLRRFVGAGLRCAQMLSFRMTSEDDSQYDRRSCMVSITDGEALRIKGSHRCDINDTVWALCRTIKFDSTLPCYLEKISAKPSVRAMTIREARLL